MRFNPNAIVFWLFLAGSGYLAAGPTGAIAGAVIGLGISFFLTLLTK